MAFFVNGTEKHRLMILYFISKAGLELTRAQLYRVMAENDWINYFDFQTTLSGLEEDAYVAAVPRVFGQGYVLTEKATEALKLFSPQLPYSLRQEMEAYANEHRQELRRELQYYAQPERQKDGSWRARLKVMDCDTVMLDIMLALPDQTFAQTACKDWQNTAPAVYQEILQRLVLDKEPAEPAAEASEKDKADS
ncbi:MAG: DUF4364 family protein [Eubacteriales bacterium]|nr:DUF4364 family protein [Eubacteriales bacterium]